MSSERLTPREWLAAKPLAEGERLYGVFSSVSAAVPLSAWNRQGMHRALQPLWQGTPYADWHEVMPYLVEPEIDGSFLDWVGETDAEDWGWLAVSSGDPERIFGHLRSLTQVRMPEGNEVFFRFWDGRHLLPILTFLGTDAATLLPMFDRYLINGRALQAAEAVLPPERPFPWWTPPQALLDSLAREDNSTLSANLLQWLQEEHPDLCDCLPEANLRLKIAHLARRGSDVATLKNALLEQLALELN
ncbi:MULTISPECIES: DUF4123 domain-containing protein [Pseudomonas]|uniref:DUF4123 domain-containing protein n=1 Tax=Pseudomonas TaxID=286 RepID=UPI0004D4EEC0|nr:MULTISPECIES: DUF4123 domain-containing protein [Pseudomonas]AMO78584.1 hypothetical protein PcP3B5_52000 [Pseudomonas citronellolis]KES20908.1 hypothetical protein FG99_28750 [Pseudomonas sp. AAC]MBH3435418.1 DUF4123 domain-containing protein [Pseudomonas citronellolis]OHR97913.1 hypothetical protein HMPREF3289_17415 [Pseudomonas sp. HMSC75E02]